MTPFMHSVAALLDGESAPVALTEDSAPVPVPVATDTQVIVRSLAEQLVSEANAILREHGDVISLIDTVGPGELAFTLGYRDRAVRVQTVMSGRSALVSLVVAGQPEPRPRRLSGEDELQALVLGLIAAS
ncbi:MAG TPA: hypothetical protein VJ914_00730 [Pseudonocardiaceae bacterium]|nr:hypothetical protein [Pseudonocardiaceae bacterium]